MYARDENVFFPGIEAVKARVDRFRDLCAGLKPPAARWAALGGYYALNSVLVMGLIITFLLSFFFILLIAVPVYGLLRLIRVPPRPAFLLGATLAGCGLIFWCYADTEKQSLGALTRVWLALISAVLAVEWVHFFVGTGPLRTTEQTPPSPAAPV